MKNPQSKLARVRLWGTLKVSRQGVERGWEWMEITCSGCRVPRSRDSLQSSTGEQMLARKLQLPLGKVVGGGDMRGIQRAMRARRHARWPRRSGGRGKGLWIPRRRGVRERNRPMWKWDGPGGVGEEGPRRRRRGAASSATLASSCSNRCGYSVVETLASVSCALSARIRRSGLGRSLQRLGDWAQAVWVRMRGGGAREA